MAKKIKFAQAVVVDCSTGAHARRDLTVEETEQRIQEIEEARREAEGRTRRERERRDAIARLRVSASANIQDVLKILRADVEA